MAEKRVPSPEEMAPIEAKLQGAWNNTLSFGRTSLQPAINTAYIGGVQLYLCKYCKSFSIASRKTFDAIGFRYINSREPTPEGLRLVGEAYTHVKASPTVVKQAIIVAIVTAISGTLTVTTPVTVPWANPRLLLAADSQYPCEALWVALNPFADFKMYNTSRSIFPQ